MTVFDSAEAATAYMRSSRNWGRWPQSSQLGAVSMITPECRRRAATLVQSGEVVSLARPAPAEWQSGGNACAPTQRIERHIGPGGGHAATDTFSVACHGLSWTHLDALGHVWDEDGMWEGRRPETAIGAAGLETGGIDAWSDGIVARGVLLDVPRFREHPFVELESPVDDEELVAVARSQGVALEPGDVLVVYSGRDAWERTNGVSYGTAGERPTVPGDAPQLRRPGLDVSCLKFIRDADCALLVWDMMDALPSRLGVPWPVHSALYLYGVGLIDNAYLENAAARCAELGRYEFLFVVAPLALAGGTGSPVNPLAIF